MGLLIWLLACTAPVQDAATCEPWSMAVGDSALFGGNSQAEALSDLPGDWPIDVVRTWTVQDGLVQRSSLAGHAMWADYDTGGGLWLQAFWSEDGAWDVVYDEPLLLLPSPLPPEWTATAGFTDATVAWGTNQGVDTVVSAVVETQDVDLDGIVFRDTSVIEAQWTRELALSSGPVAWSERLWVHECHGVVARESRGIGVRLVP